MWGSDFEGYHAEIYEQLMLMLYTFSMIEYDTWGLSHKMYWMWMGLASCCKIASLKWEKFFSSINVSDDSAIYLAKIKERCRKAANKEIWTCTKVSSF